MNSLSLEISLFAGMNCTYIVPVPLKIADASSPSDLQPCSSEAEVSLHDMLTGGATVESVSIEFAPRTNATTDALFYSITMEGFDNTNHSHSKVSAANYDG